jgi:hypothetical protein
MPARAHPAINGALVHQRQSVRGGLGVTGWVTGGYREGQALAVCRPEEAGPLAPHRRPVARSCPVTLEEISVSRFRSRLTAIVTVVALLAAIVPAASAARPTPPPPAQKPSTDKAIFFASDGTART